MVWPIIGERLPSRRLAGFRASLSKCAFPGFRELVSGAALRLKYSTGDELRILCRKRCFIAILDEVNLTAASRGTMKCGHFGKTGSGQGGSTVRRKLTSSPPYVSRSARYTPTDL